MPFRGILEYLGYQFSSVQSSHSVMSDALRPHETAVPQTSLSITTSQNLLILMSIELVMPSKYLIFYHSLSSCFNLSRHQIFFNKSLLHIKWPNYGRFSLSISPASWESCMQVRKQVRTAHGTTDWFQIGKGVRQGCILSPCSLNFYAEYIMRNARLEEAQAAIKIVRRNINNLIYADDTTLMAESEEELKSLLMKVKVKILA